MYWARICEARKPGYSLDGETTICFVGVFTRKINPGLGSLHGWE
jgi:hypothetical protein